MEGNTEKGRGEMRFCDFWKVSKNMDMEDSTRSEKVGKLRFRDLWKVSNDMDMEYDTEKSINNKFRNFWTVRQYMDMEDELARIWTWKTRLKK